MTWYVESGMIAAPRRWQSGWDFVSVKPQPGETRRQPVMFVPFEATAESVEHATTAVGLAQQTSARIVFFYAVQLNVTRFGPANPAWLKHALRMEATEMIEPVLRFAKSIGVPATWIVEEVRGPAAIAGAAKKWEADVLVLGKRRGGGLSGWFEQRELDRMIRNAECPVLVVNKKRRKPW